MQTNLTVFAVVIAVATAVMMLAAANGVDTPAMREAFALGRNPEAFAHHIQGVFANATGAIEGCAWYPDHMRMTPDGSITAMHVADPMFGTPGVYMANVSVPLDHECSGEDAATPCDSRHHVNIGVVMHVGTDRLCTGTGSAVYVVPPPGPGDTMHTGLGLVLATGGSFAAAHVADVGLGLSTHTITQKLAQIDILAVDARGTGWSCPMTCPRAVAAFGSTRVATAADIDAYDAALVRYRTECEEEMFAPDGVPADAMCITDADAGEDLGRQRRRVADFTRGRDVAHDLAYLIKKLGYQRVYIYGVSYASLIAHELRCLIPDITAHVVLESPVDPQTSLADMAGNTWVDRNRYVDMIATMCAKTPACLVDATDVAIGLGLSSAADPHGIALVHAVLSDVLSSPPAECSSEKCASAPTPDDRVAAMRSVIQSFRFYPVSAQAQLVHTLLDTARSRNYTQFRTWDHETAMLMVNAYSDSLPDGWILAHDLPPWHASNVTDAIHSGMPNPAWKFYATASQHMPRADGAAATAEQTTADLVRHIDKFIRFDAGIITGQFEAPGLAFVQHGVDAATPDLACQQAWRESHEIPVVIAVADPDPRTTQFDAQALFDGCGSKHAKFVTAVGVAHGPSRAWILETATGSDREYARIIMGVMGPLVDMHIGQDTYHISRDQWVDRVAPFENYVPLSEQN